MGGRVGQATDTIAATQLDSCNLHKGSVLPRNRTLMELQIGGGKNSVNPALDETEREIRLCPFSQNKTATAHYILPDSQSSKDNDERGCSPRMQYRAIRTAASREQSQYYDRDL